MKRNVLFTLHMEGMQAFDAGSIIREKKYIYINIYIILHIMFHVNIKKFSQSILVQQVKDGQCVSII